MKRTRSFKSTPKLDLKKLSATTKLVLNRNLPTQTVVEAQKEIEEGKIDLDKGMEQFYGAQKERIEYALVTGDQSQLSSGEKAWIATMAERKEGEILSSLSDEQAELLAIATETEAERQELLAQQARNQKMQTVKQIAIYGAVMLLGGSLLYYVSKR